MSTGARDPSAPSEPTAPGSPGLGPAEHEVEQPPADPSTLDLWASLLAGPVIWIVHFMAVYLLAEAVCTSLDDGVGFLGEDGLVVTIVAATAPAVVAVAGIARWAWRRTRSRAGDDHVLGWAGVLLSAGSVAAILAVAVPALVLDPC